MRDFLVFDSKELNCKSFRNWIRIEDGKQKRESDDLEKGRFTWKHDWYESADLRTC